MNVFYEEEGSFKVASIMSESPAALQVESVSGKRSKIKTNNVLMQFEAPLSSFMDAALAEAENLEIDFMGMLRRARIRVWRFSDGILWQET